MTTKGRTPLTNHDIVILVSINPSEPEAEGDPDAWALSIAREILRLHGLNGKMPILVWPDPECPAVAVVGKKKQVDVAKKNAKMNRK